MKIAIVGSRTFENLQLVRDIVAALPANSIVVSGGAPGVDTVAVRAAEARGLKTLVIRADWDKLGRAAGPIRNSEIVNAADQILAFWDGKSSGTADTIGRAMRSGKPWKVLSKTSSVVDSDVS